jgi:CHAT domain-containing protein/Tfp pilus assembly protein PilF
MEIESLLVVIDDNTSIDLKTMPKNKIALILSSFSLLFCLPGSIAATSPQTPLLEGDLTSPQTPLLVGEGLIAPPSLAGKGAGGLGSLAQQPTTTTQQQQRTQAEQLLKEGLQLFQQGTLESLQQARIKFEQALPMWRAIGDKQGEAATILGISRISDLLGEKQKAIEYYNQALPLYQAVGDRGGEATTLNNLGLVYDSLGEKQKAIEFYNQALPLYQAVGDRGGEATTLNNLGLVYDSLGEKQKAIEFYVRALPILRAVGDRGGEATTLYNIAYFQRSEGKLTEALTNIKAAVDIIESLRSKIVSPELRTSYFATVQDYYEFYTNLLMQLHQQDPSKGYDAEALHIAERSKARSLLELIAEANADIRQGIDPKLLVREKVLQYKLDAVEKQLNDNPPPAQQQTLERERNNLLEQYQQLRTEIRLKSPNYAALTQPQPLNLQQIQAKVLDKDTLLLEYFLGEERSYLWVVGKNSFTSYTLPARQEIEKAVKQFRGHLTDPAPDFSRLLRDSTALSKLILAPAVNQLGNKRLLIVADGALQTIPFAALSLSDKQEYLPLATNYEIVNSPSASTIAIVREQLKSRQKPAKELVIMADPVFTKDDTRVVTSPPTPLLPGEGSNEGSEDLNLIAMNRSLDEIRLNIGRLPGTRAEAEAIMTLIPESERMQVFDFDANKTIATSPELKDYRIVHFATHGIANPDKPELSAVIMSLVDKQGRTENGFLRLNDIFNLTLNADLVVLSACQTGLGQSVKGEGLVGLTRGFMYAGTPRLAVSLWNVDDEATAELMKRFYSLMLEEKLPPAKALRQAQLQLQQETEWKAPYFWSAFTMQGEWR